MTSVIPLGLLGLHSPAWFDARDGEGSQNDGVAQVRVELQCFVRKRLDRGPILRNGCSLCLSEKTFDDSSDALWGHAKSVSSQPNAAMSRRRGPHGSDVELVSARTTCEALQRLPLRERRVSAPLDFDFAWVSSLHPVARLPRAGSEPSRGMMEMRRGSSRRPSPVPYRALRLPVAAPLPGSR